MVKCFCIRIIRENKQIGLISFRRFTFSRRFFFFFFLLKYNIVVVAVVVCFCLFVSSYFFLFLVDLTAVFL